jgi:hypothetical protein
MPSLFGPGLGQSAGGGRSVHVPTVQGGGDSLANISQRLGGLVAKVKEMKAQLGNVTVHCGGQTFWLIEDCETFVVQKVPGNMYAYFYDMVSLLLQRDDWGKIMCPSLTCGTRRTT